MNLIKIIILKLIRILYLFLYWIVPTDKKTIIFESNLGKNYTGNPKAIYEKMVEDKLDEKYTCIWILNDTNISIPGNCIKVKKMRFLYLYYLNRASFWVFDTRQPLFVKKKRKTTYVQTWHGTPLKRLALDMETINMGGEKDIELYKDRFRRSVKRWDFLLSQNNYSTNIFKRAFAFDKEILELGYPRNDKLVNFDFNNINLLKEKLGLPTDKKVILYAPTWRDNAYYEKGKYKFESNIDLKYMYEQLGEEYIIINKAHYLVVDNLDSEGLNDFVYTFSNNQDITDLYLVSDILITDYSSVMFDFSVLNRPMIFYVYDIEMYGNDLRGFYFDLKEEAPGPLVKTTRDLVSEVKKISDGYNENYNEKYAKFREKYNYLDKGNSSKEFINRFFK